MDYKNTEGMLPSEKAKLYKRLYSDMKVAVEVVPEETPKKGRPKKAENSKKKERSDWMKKWRLVSERAEISFTGIYGWQK